MMLRICPRSSGVQESNGAAEAVVACQTSADRPPYPAPPPPHPPAQAGEGKVRAAGKGRMGSDQIPLGIAFMITSTILFAGSSALSKWLVATYPIGEMLFVRAATALIGSSLVILPVTGLAVFRTKRLRDHMVRGISQSCA